MSEPARQYLFRVRDYDLAATLPSGQAFRWRECQVESLALRGESDGTPVAARPVPPALNSWEGVIAGKWVRLTQVPEGIAAETARPVADWSWLAHYLQTEIDLASVLRSFPRRRADAPRHRRVPRSAAASMQPMRWRPAPPGR